MIYLDNGATSYPKPREVIKAVSECMENWCANPGRSGHMNAMTSAEEVYKTRKKIAELTGVNAEGVVFTSNCTSALNMAMRGILKPGDHVVATVMEHNSVLRTLYSMREKRISTTLVGSDNRGVINGINFEKAITKNTRMIICSLASNVTGNILPIAEVAETARKHSIYFMLDASQGMGNLDIDMSSINPDIICCSGHKSLMGPQGTGFMAVKENVEIRPIITGGTGTFSEKLIQPDIMPEGYEAGTINVPGIVGLRAGIDYIENRRIRDIRKLEEDLIGCLQEELRGNKKIVRYGVEDPSERAGIFSFNVEGMDCEEVAEMMDKEYGIAVRAGYHCAPEAHRAIGTDRIGCVRISVGPFTKYEDIIKTAEAIRKITNC